MFTLKRELCSSVIQFLPLTDYSCRRSVIEGFRIASRAALKALENSATDHG